jgi:hypothetical protein
VLLRHRYAVHARIDDEVRCVAVVAHPLVHCAQKVGPLGTSGAVQAALALCSLGIICRRVVTIGTPSAGRHSEALSVVNCISLVVQKHTTEAELSSESRLRP